MSITIMSEIIVFHGNEALMTKKTYKIANMIG